VSRERNLIRVSGNVRSRRERRPLNQSRQTGGKKVAGWLRGEKAVGEVVRAAVPNGVVYVQEEKKQCLNNRIVRQNRRP